MNKAIALQLAGMINVAYNQYDGTSSPAGALPAGVVIEDTLTAVENGKQVPFGFVASQVLPGKLVTAFVVIRGTRSLLEWLDDAFIVPTPPGGLAYFGTTTKGFNDLYRQLSPQIIKTLQRLKPGAVLITGHSLGAALAHLCAVDVRHNLGIVPESYTFCGPRCGDIAFARAFAAAGLTTWRIFNTEDIVPTVPPATTDASASVKSVSDLLLSLFHRSPCLFEHVGVPIPVTINGGSLEANHDLANILGAL